jgi:tetratricopeptide (TPR) repeat protein
MIPSAPLDKKKVVRSVLLVVAFGFLCLQVFRWQNFAFEVTWLSLKSGTVGLNFQNRLRFGSICNSIGNYGCSEEQFQQALILTPGHLSSLGNLAIAQSHMGENEAALQSFEKYFLGGGLAYDVMYYYAQHLINNGYFENGINWLYRSLSVHTSNQAVANELLDRLTLEERFFEALSLSGALIESDPTSQEFWRSKQQSLLQFLDTQDAKREAAKKKGKEEEKEDEALRIPSLDGKTYLVPVRYDESSPWSLFMMDRGEPDTLVNAAVLSKWSYELFEKIRSQQKDSGDKVKFQLKHISVGPWTIETLDATFCEKCQSRLGRNILNDLDVQKGDDQIMDFLVIRPPSSKESE